MISGRSAAALTIASPAFFATSTTKPPSSRRCAAATSASRSSSTSRSRYLSIDDRSDAGSLGTLTEWSYELPRSPWPTAEQRQLQNPPGGKQIPAPVPNMNAGAPRPWTARECQGCGQETVNHTFDGRASNCRTPARRLADSRGRELFTGGGGRLGIGCHCSSL